MPTGETGSWDSLKGGEFTKEFRQFSIRTITLGGGGTVYKRIHPLDATNYSVTIEIGTTGVIVLPDLSGMVKQKGTTVHRILSDSPSGALVNVEDIYGRSYGSIAQGDIGFVECILDTVAGVDPGVPIFVLNKRTAGARPTDRQFP